MSMKPDRAECEFSQDCESEAKQSDGFIRIQEKSETKMSVKPDRAECEFSQDCESEAKQSAGFIRK